MPSVGRACPRNSSACVITSLVLSEGLLICVVIFLSLTWKHIVGEGDSTLHDCRSRVTVVTHEAQKQKWDACSERFRQASFSLEENLREPTNSYMERRHSSALYLYTNMTLQPVLQNFRSAETTGKQKVAYEPHSLYSSLSEAIQMLKHNQATCLRTHYRTETAVHPNISASQIRFSTFILGSDKWNVAGNSSCFNIYSCFGANITHYSASKENNQVLIPPYEVFKVTEIQKQTNSCRVIYKLRSNMNCVYDRESNQLYPISALTVEGFWFIFTLTCFIIMSLLVPFIILKVYYNRKAVYCVSSSYNSTAIHL